MRNFWRMFLQEVLLCLFLFVALIGFLEKCLMELPDHVPYFFRLGGLKFLDVNSPRCLFERFNNYEFLPYDQDITVGQVPFTDFKFHHVYDCFYK